MDKKDESLKFVLESFAAELSKRFEVIRSEHVPGFSGAVFEARVFFPDRNFVSSEKIEWHGEDEKMFISKLVDSLLQKLQPPTPTQ